MLGGVCGGLGEYFDIDPVIPRIIFVLLALPGGAPGIIPYIILWIVIPQKGNESDGQER
jgi:phage shock protein C